MPQIRDYTAQADSLRPSETGVEALAMEGRRVGVFYDQAANTIKQSAADQARAAQGVAAGAETEARSFSGIAKSVTEAGDQAAAYVEHREISHGAATLAQLNSDLTDAWNDAAKNADPNDPSIAGKFRETQLEPALDKFTSSFSTTQGQQWAEQHTAALRDHMFEKQTADMSRLAGDAVDVNVRQMTNAWSNTARNDPSSVPYLLKTADSSVAGVVGTSPNLKGVDAAHVHSQVTQKAKEDIVRAGALGAIEKSGDPEAAAAAFAKRYPQFVNAQEIDQFAKAAKAYQHAGREDSERALRLQKQQADDRSEAQRDKYIQDVFSDQPQATMKQVLSDPNLVPKDREHLIGVMQKEGKAQMSDEPTKTGLVRNLLDPEKPTTIYDVMRAHAAGKINDQDFSRLESSVKLAQEAPIQEPIFKATMQGAEKLIGTDPVGSSKHAQFMAAFMPQYLQQYRAGTLPPNALDLNDEKSMISQAMKPYLRSGAQQMMDRATRGGGIEFPGGENPPAPPRAAPGGFVNVPPIMKTDEEIKAWVKAQGYATGTRLKRADGKIGTVP